MEAIKKFLWLITLYLLVSQVHAVNLLNLKIELPPGTQNLHNEKVILDPANQTSLEISTYQLLGNILFGAAVATSNHPELVTSLDDQKNVIVSLIQGLKQKSNAIDFNESQIRNGIKQVMINGHNYQVYEESDSKQSLLIYTLPVHDHLYNLYAFSFSIPGPLNEENRQIIANLLNTIVC